MDPAKDTPPVQRALSKRMLPGCHPGNSEYEATKALFSQAGIVASYDVQAVANCSLEVWIQQVEGNGISAALASLLHQICVEHLEEHLGRSLSGKEDGKKQQSGVRSR